MLYRCYSAMYSAHHDRAGGAGAGPLCASDLRFNCLLGLYLIRPLVTWLYHPPQPSSALLEVEDGVNGNKGVIPDPDHLRSPVPVTQSLGLVSR